MSDDLKQRLRRVEGGNHYGATVWYKNPDGPEAADRIEKLEAALQRANANVEEYERKFYLGTDRIEKLEAALREIIDMHPFKTPDGEASIKGLVDLVFYINLTARRALNTSEERVNKTGET